MKSFILLCSICLTLISIKANSAEDCVTCDGKLKSNTEAIDKLSIAIKKVVANQFIKVAELKVKHAGDGDLSVLVDESGDVLAIKFHYVDGDEKKDFTVSVKEFNAGKGITYPASKNNVSPLKLSAVIPPGINVKRGGEFNLTIGVKIDPPKYQNNSIKLFKKNGKWQITSKNGPIKKVTLSPGISWAAWNGTFEKVDFN